MKTWLLDTGPLVAYLNASDPFHPRAVSVINNFRGEFVTTSAVIVEAMFFVRRFLDGPERLLKLLEEAEVDIADSCQRQPLRLAVELMRKYADLPMDFADASLVVIADQLRLNEICTIDRRGFSVFRTLSGKRFRIVLDDET